MQWPFQNELGYKQVFSAWSREVEDDWMVCSFVLSAALPFTAQDLLATKPVVLYGHCLLSY